MGRIDSPETGEMDPPKPGKAGCPDRRRDRSGFRFFIGPGETGAFMGAEDRIGVVRPGFTGAETPLETLFSRKFVVRMVCDKGIFQNQGYEKETENMNHLM